MTTKKATEERLRSMVRVMKHDLGSPEEYLFLGNGGIALIGNSSFEESRSVWNEERGSCLALCGHLVGIKDDNGANSRENGKDEYSMLTEGVGPLLRAFEDHGEDIIEKLNGVFVFAHHDTATGSLTLVNDRYGFMPLYYYCREGVFLFASEVKAILRVLKPQEFDWESFADFFYLGQMMGQKTLFKDVRAMDTGQMLVYRNGALRKSQYCDFTKTTVLEPNEASTEKAASLFMQAVRRRVKKDLPNTVLLSGGFDSRLILGALHNLQVTPRVLTLEHGRQRRGTDSRFAAGVANRLGLEIDFRQTRPDFFSSEDCLETFYIQDGMFNTWEGFAMEIYPELDSSMGAVWNGLALDVALGSSRQREVGTQTNTPRNLEQFAGGTGRLVGIPSRRLNRFLLRLILTPRQFNLLDNGFMRRLRDELARIPESENQFQNFILRHQVRRRVAIMPHQLFSTKIEPVTPAADIDFMDFVLSIPQSLKHNHRFYIDMLRKHFPLLAEVPVISGGFEFHFASDELRKQRSVGSRLKLKLARAWLYLRVSASRWTSRTDMRKYSPLAKRPTRLPPELLIYVVQKKNFDRPFYNKRLLRRLFTAYRNGLFICHPLFAIVFYIELWHLLFADEDSPILFNPRNLGYFQNKME